MKNKKVWNYGQFRPPQGPFLFATQHANLYVFLFFLSYLLNLHQIDSIACKKLRIVETVLVSGARAVALKRGFLRNAKLAVVPHLALFSLP